MDIQVEEPTKMILPTQSTLRNFWPRLSRLGFSVRRNGTMMIPYAQMGNLASASQQEGNRRQSLATHIR